jgi:hypothetical protein
MDERCEFCGRPIFQERDGTWNLVYREYDNTRVCDALGNGWEVSVHPHEPVWTNEETHQEYLQRQTAPLFGPS